ncbi:MAG: superoxide dismutase family protein [Gemmatimonadaceae bacterium]|nr:superoxide dismutase family protein [Gemmatimonadaceae bacterium]
MIIRVRIATLAMSGLLASACATSRPAQGAAAIATATLRAADGREVGTATLRKVDDALQLELDVNGLPDGTHGLHFHTVGKCDAPGFATAGGHLNPGGTKHGMQNPQGPHAGDLPNLVIAGGQARGWTARTQRVVADSTPGGLFDADGTALVIHANRDDDVTDPSGNSGARIACGVIRRM